MPSNDALGCMVMFGAAFSAIGAGLLYGAGAGFLTLGGWFAVVILLAWLSK